MSVAARSPHHGNKRHFEPSSDSPEPYSTDRSSGPSNKRYRQYNPQSLRCAPLAERQPYVVSSTTLQALKGLFPDMDDKIIGDVLDACGDNIDSAIKQLGQLRLTAHCGTSQPSPSGADQAANPSAAAGSQAAGPSVPSSAQAAPPVAKAKSPQEWVETLVQQMASARDMADARSRAASILQTFQQAVLHTSGPQDALNPSGLKSQLAELQHNNSILKRAVAIQNNRIQDLSSREAESQQLKQVVAQLQEKCHGLEMNNYSLAMHLRHATDNGSQSQQGQRHPDVY